MFESSIYITSPFNRTTTALEGSLKPSRELFPSPFRGCWTDCRSRRSTSAWCVPLLRVRRNSTVVSDLSALPSAVGLLSMSPISGFWWHWRSPVEVFEREVPLDLFEKQLDFQRLRYMAMISSGSESKSFVSSDTCLCFLMSQYVIILALWYIFSPYCFCFRNMTSCIRTSVRPSPVWYIVSESMLYLRFFFIFVTYMTPRSVNCRDFS